MIKRRPDLLCGVANYPRGSQKNTAETCLTRMSLVNQCGLAPRSKALVLRMWTRELSSPTDRTFQIRFAVAASTLAGYWAALSLQTSP